MLAILVGQFSQHREKNRWSCVQTPLSVWCGVDV